MLPSIQIHPAHSVLFRCMKNTTTSLIIPQLVRKIEFQYIPQSPALSVTQNYATSDKIMLSDTKWPLWSWCVLYNDEQNFVPT